MKLHNHITENAPSPSASDRRETQGEPSWGGDVLWLVVLSLLFVACNQSGNTPLYADETGWQIYSAKAGDEIVEPYLRANEIARENGWGQIAVPGLDYLVDDPLSFYGFALVLNDNVLTWEENSEIVLSFIVNDDTLSARSVEIFFCEPYSFPQAAMPGEPLYGPITVPNQYYKVFETSKGNPVVFARFRFEKEPDYLVKCTVSNVHSNRKEVAR